MNREASEQAITICQECGAEQEPEDLIPMGLLDVAWLICADCAGYLNLVLWVH